MQVFFDCSEVVPSDTRRVCLLCGEIFHKGAPMVDVVAHEREDMSWVSKGAAHPDCVDSAKIRCAACSEKCHMKHGLCKLE